ncbi:MAG: UDP-N-acetylglucosamine 1-carboxyvinyltransferase [Patescibacteria group bacterium]
MDKNDEFIIQGLAGEKKLHGAVIINGAKNSALKAMAASILFDGPVILENVPDNSDIQTMISILEKMGAKINVKEKSFTSFPASPEPQRASKNSGGLILEIDATGINSTEIDPELATSMRASIVLTGSLMGRFGKVSFPAPGGCVIGARPIDLFLSGYGKMGATVKEENDCLHKISAIDGLKGAEITFSKISVGATETLMMAAVLAKGKTVLNNCAREPEIANVAEWLNVCGANIKGIGTPTIEVEGTNGKLLSFKESFVTIPDRIEAGSFLILGALCAKKLKIEKCQPKHMNTVVKLLVELGVNIKIEKDSIIVSASDFINSTLPRSIKTLEYPGFPTDLQPPLVVFLTQIKGQFSIRETIFEGRFKYVGDLIKMGANITTINSREIKIKGPTPLHELSENEELTAHDIRAGFALIVAALIGNGKFTINNVHLIDRGYEKIEERLKILGVEIERTDKAR